jgi:hypothetical protein
MEGLNSTDYKNPGSMQYSVGLQQQLGRDSILSIAYVGNQNRHQFAYRQFNLPPESDLVNLIGASSYTYDTALQYVGFSSINQAECAENSHYNGFQVQLKSRLHRDLTLDASFTWSRTIDPGVVSASNANSDDSQTDNPYSYKYDVGPSILDRTAIGLVSFVYDIPWLRHSNNHLLRTGLGGWELSAIGTMETGIPLPITLSGSQSANAVQNGTNRPDITGSVSNPHTYAQWFSGNFSVPTPSAAPPYGWGNLPNGAVRSPGRDNWNISLFKDFVLNETRGSLIELRFESFNTLNHTQFNGVSNSYGSSNFGAVTSVWDPRVFQFGIKLKF